MSACGRWALSSLPPRIYCCGFVNHIIKLSTGVHEARRMAQEGPSLEQACKAKCLSPVTSTLTSQTYILTGAHLGQ